MCPRPVTGIKLDGSKKVLIQVSFSAFTQNGRYPYVDLVSHRGRYDAKRLRGLRKKGRSQEVRVVVIYKL